MAANHLACYFHNQEGAVAGNKDVWARNFVDMAHQHSGLFVEYDTGTYTFSHKNFLEYLAATALVDKSDQTMLNLVLAVFDEFEPYLCQRHANCQLCLPARRVGNRTVVMGTIRQPGLLASVTAFLEENRQLAVEAENYSMSRTGEGFVRSWHYQADQGDYGGGGYMRASPDMGVQTVAGTWEKTSLAFNIQIVNPGSYMIWARSMAPNGEGGSVHVHISDTLHSLTSFPPHDGASICAVDQIQLARGPIVDFRLTSNNALCDPYNVMGFETLNLRGMKRLLGSR